MKNFPLLLGIVAPFFFSGCGGESSSPVNDANSSSPVETATTNVADKPKLPPLVPTIELTGAETQPFAYLKTIDHCVAQALAEGRCRGASGKA